MKEPLFLSAHPLSLRFSLSFPHASHHPSSLNPKSHFSPSRGAGGVSADASGFPYTLQGGLWYAIRVARVVKEAVDRNESEVRWFVFGDDNTVFFVDNVMRTLSKYDHDRWFYIGSNSESYDQNLMYSFEMAFGGGGFTISHSLAGVLSRVLDSCLRRFGHLYGNDSRIYSCVAELGIALTHEPGFHQIVVDFTASWCGLCRFIAPILAEIAKKLPNVTFLKVDVDELKTVAEEWVVEAVPTFLFLKEGKLVDKVVGAKKEEMQLTISKHATADA